MHGQIEGMAPETLVATVRPHFTGGARVVPHLTMSPFALLAALMARCLLSCLGYLLLGG